MTSAPVFIIKKYFPALLIVAVVMACNGSGNPPKEAGNSATNEIPEIPYTVVDTFLHDTSAFTEGLTFYKGQLYESTGNPDTLLKGSWIGTTDLITGKSYPKAFLDTPQFGEGMTILQNKVYYLTYKHRKGYIYDLATFKKIREFSYHTEGWGLTNNGKHLIMSDGSNNLYYYEPDSMKLVTTKGVLDNNGPVPNINELEYIDGFVYANQWLTPYILKIEPSSGNVVGRIDLSNLIKRAQEKYPDANELNGIAYDSATRKIYVTGKYWPEIFGIDLTQVH